MRKTKKKLENKNIEKEKKVKEEDKKLDKTQEKQIKWVIVLIAGIFLITFGIYYIIQESKKFEFVGLNFEKIKYGKLIFYHTWMQVSNVDSSTGLETKNSYEIYLRKDPRKSKVPVNASVRFRKGIALISIDTNEFRDCDDTTIAIVNFARILGVMGISAMGATPDINSSRPDMPYVTCENIKDNTVMLIKQSNITAISQDSENKDCYILEVANCEILDVSEKFILTAIAQSRKISI